MTDGEDDKVEASSSLHPPKGKLASVTRKKNEIDKLLVDIPSNLNLIKANYQEYLNRVENFYEACGTQHDDWLLPHKTSIEMFRIKIVGIIHPGTSHNIGAINKHRALSATSSTTSSARVRLAEERAALAAHKESLTKSMELESIELELKAKFDKEMLLVKQQRQQLEAHTNEKRIETFEQELNAIDGHDNLSNLSNETEENSLDIRAPSKSRNVITTQRHQEDVPDNSLLKILERQNEISVTMTNCQQKSMLPKKEVRIFDGSDLTLFKTFMLNFERVIEVKCSDDCEKLVYLEQHTSGRAGDLVKTCCHYDPVTGFAKAKELLINEYGNEFKISNAYIEKLDNWPRISSEDVNALQELSIFLLNCQHYLENMSLCNQLQSPKELMSIVLKLPYDMRKRWRRMTHQVISRNEAVKFKQLVDFVQEETSVLKQPLFGLIHDDKKKTDNVKSKKSFATKLSSQSSSSVHSKSTEITTSKYCEYCKKDNHYISSCKFFKVKSADEKSDFVKERKLCFGCLRKDHVSRDCTKRQTCSICQRNHPTVLHIYRSNSSVVPSNNVLTQPNASSVVPAIDESGRSHDQVASPSGSTTGETATQNNIPTSTSAYSNNNKTSSNREKVISPILPAKVRITGSDKELTVNCVLDACSTDCWINEKFVNLLGVHCQSETLKLNTMNGLNSKITTNVVNNLQISDLDGNNRVIVPVVYTKPDNKWPFSANDKVSYDEIKQYPHLRNVPFNFHDADIGILIGMNVPSLIKATGIVEDSNFLPFASQHALGWTFNGPVSRLYDTRHNFRVVVDRDVDLKPQIETLFNQDFLDDSLEQDLSQNDKLWLTKVTSSLHKLDDGHFEIDLPFKDSVNFPDNRQQALGRFMGTLKRINKDNKYAEDYRKFMSTMIEKKFMEKIPDSELEIKPGARWYLTHHGVYHKIKQKIRVVFNCSLKYHGVSLNDNLLQGPDYTNNLFGVLTRFRQAPIAVIADLEKMYYQVKVPQHHANYLRLFWLNSENLPVEYRLRVHVFGATSSPSVACFALRETAKDKTCKNKDVSDAILSSFYVDDFLISKDSVFEATSITNSVKNVVSKGGFNLTGFNSNSPEVLKSVSESCCSRDSSPVAAAPPSDQRALGVTWNTKTDKFGFDISIEDNNSPCTKRYLLKTLASLYDPIGFAAPVVVIAKKLFQRSCREKLGWDDNLSPDIQKAWNDWVKQVQSLKNYEIPRSLKLKLSPIAMQMHTFVDGSETAYAAVTYLKVLYENSSPSISILSSKSRMTPLNNCTLKTIPRIELCSAKLGVELANKLQKELHIKIDERFFYTDSTTVLRYIQNDSLRFHRFVHNKVCFIRNFSNPQEWNFVRSNDNPADLGSRGITASGLIASDLWNNVPLLLNPIVIESDLESKIIDETDVELKSTVSVATHVRKCIISPVDKVVQSSSSLFKVKIRVAWLLKLKHCLRTKTGLKSAKLTATDIAASETEIIKHDQRFHFAELIENLNNLRSQRKSCSLRKLRPFIDEKGIMRVGGRIENSMVNYSTRHPIILSQHSAVSTLIMNSIHRQVGHLGRETMLSTLREKYWIIKGNSLARKIIRDCIICKKIQGKPGEQIMSDLPAKRLTADTPAFTHVGIDFFGPISVSHGRKSEKRYGIIFTCLSSRALHLEVGYSLTTDSFLNALRRFVSRRGNVKSITTDNGTNLVGGNKELKDSIRNWNQSIVHKWMLQRQIDWTFNPPSGSHFGGCFEREVRTVKKVLTSIISEQIIKLNDDLFSTLLCEIEAILNNRPLTEVTSDPNDIEALTPNHLLLLNAGITFPPGLFEKDDLYCKRRWRQVQFLVNLFWRRWQKQYVVLLQERAKWHVPKRSFEPNDLVLIVDNQLPRNQWLLGRISEVYKDKFGYVRSASIRVSKCKNSRLTDFNTSIIIRPIVKLVLLSSAE